jgi:hypothetical protein
MRKEKALTNDEDTRRRRKKRNKRKRRRKNAKETGREKDLGKYSLKNRLKSTDMIQIDRLYILQ